MLPALLDEPKLPRAEFTAKLAKNTIKISPVGGTPWLVPAPILPRFFVRVASFAVGEAACCSARYSTRMRFTHKLTGAPHYSSPRRFFLIRARLFFSAIRRSTEPRVGRVFRRVLGMCCAATIRRRSRARHSSRF